MRVVYYAHVIPADFVHRDEVADGFLKRPEGIVMVEVADMLADKGLTVHHQRNRVLEVGPDGEQRARGWKRRDGAGSESASPSQDRDAEGTGAGHRVIHPARNRSLADQKRVGNPSQAFERV